MFKGVIGDTQTLALIALSCESELNLVLENSVTLVTSLDNLLA
jgi:hypothetical protein